MKSFSPYTVPSRVLYTWIYNNAGKSVSGAASFHATSNVSWQLFPDHGSNYDPCITGILVAIVAVFVTLRWGPRTLSHDRRP